jgi:hypothetical protein
MSIPRSVAEVIRDHVTLEVEGIDRMYLNVYQPKLQTEKQAACFFRFHRGQPVASSSLMGVMSNDFLSRVEAFIEEHQIPVVHFKKKQRKDDVAAEYRARFPGTEGVLFLGKAQEKVAVFRTEKLVRFLPVQAERYRSQAQNQLGDALELLRTTQVLKSAEWTESKSGIAALLLARGDRLASAAKRTPMLGPISLDELAENGEVKELRYLVPPESQLVNLFYQEWSGAKPLMPTTKELEQARLHLKEHGPQRAKTIVRHAIKHMKVRFPDAKAFGAISFYLTEAIADADKAERRAAVEKEERRQMDAEEGLLKRRRQEQQELEEVWLPRWKALAENEQQEIAQAVLTTFPRFDRLPHLLEKRCVVELRDRTMRRPRSASAPASMT